MDAEERFLGVRGYRPRQVHTAAELSEADRMRLRSLLGRPLRRSLAMWDVRHGCWFTDGPVVLEFENDHLELAGFKFHLCLSWDSIATDQEIEWYPGSPLELRWRQNALEALEPLRDQPLEEISIVQYDDMLNGFGFRAGRAYAEVFNALDELGIRDADEPLPGARRTSL